MERDAHWDLLGNPGCLTLAPPRQEAGTGTPERESSRALQAILRCRPVRGLLLRAGTPPLAHVHAFVLFQSENRLMGFSNCASEAVRCATIRKEGRI